MAYVTDEKCFLGGHVKCTEGEKKTIFKELIIWFLILACSVSHMVKKAHLCIFRGHLSGNALRRLKWLCVITSSKRQGSTLWPLGSKGQPDPATDHFDTSAAWHLVVELKPELQWHFLGITYVTFTIFPPKSSSFFKRHPGNWMPLPTGSGIPSVEGAHLLHSWVLFCVYDNRPAVTITV